jgi:hypothetical protein
MISAGGLLRCRIKRPFRMTPMRDENSAFEMLKIARATSVRVEGLALREALKNAGYKAARRVIGPTELLDVLHKRPELATDWASCPMDERPKVSGEQFLISSA